MQKRVVLVGALLIALTLVAPAASAGPSADPPSATDARLEQIAATMSTLGVPGYIQSVHGQCADSQIVQGITEFEGTTPLPADARFHIGSITKTFTATVILQLVEEGLIGLDEPINEWQPTIPNADQITIRMLLNHTSGLFDYSSDPSWVMQLESDPLFVWPPQELVDIGALENPPYFPPGQGWTYSNTNYIILGLIAETVTGQSIEDLVTQRVIGPAGLGGTSFPTTPGVPPPATTGAVVEVGTGQGALVDFDPSAFWAAGAMIGTNPDLQRWSEVLATGALLTPEMQAQRLTFVDTGITLAPFPGFTGPSLPVFYGLGIFEVGGYLGHNGEVPGYLAYVLHNPISGTTIALNQNAELVDPNASPSFQLDLANLQNEMLMAILGALELCPVRVQPTFTG